MVFSPNNVPLVLLLLAAAALGGALAQLPNCPDGSGSCDFSPFNPISCGAPDFVCGYSTFCEAIGAGYDLATECCQAPQPSICPAIFDPLICGTQKCPYANSCIASLAGFTPESQCEAATDECPSPADSSQCTTEESPLKCGVAAKTCKYASSCLAQNAGFNVDADCCPDSSGTTACSPILKPVSCGVPGGKQCLYDTQCEADAAGYDGETQCCPAVPEGTACLGISAPVTCGSVPCQYVSQCEASAAGFAEADCCPQLSGDPCRAELSPVACGPAMTCLYAGLECAASAGFTADDCCRQPDRGSCSNEYIPHTCGQVGCVYANGCIAKLAGFDPDSCVKGVVLCCGDGGSAASVVDEAAALSMAAATAMFSLWVL